ncbi:MAG: hypothetical protein AAGA87_09920 [Pseudomonadota bacterium]
MIPLRNLLNGVTASAFACTLSCGAAVSQETVTWKDDVKGWYIGVDRTVGNGCFLSSIFEGGSLFRMGYFPSDEVFRVMVGDDDWKSLEEGKLYPIEVKFGNLSPWTGNASVFIWSDGDKSLVLSLPFENDVAENFIGEFKRMTTVAVNYEGQEILKLSLKGSFAAADEMLRCQLAVSEETQPSTSSDPFSSNGSDNSDPFD